MNYRRLGRSGVKVSEVALGSWLTIGRTVAETTGRTLVHKAFDLGINFFDTADVYNKGEAEKALGRVIGDFRRDDLFLATKCFFPMSERPNDQGLSKKHIVESVHNSLARLGTDYIDLFQFHRMDPETPVDETVRAIDELIKQGKVLYWGVSQWPAERIREAASVARELNANPPSSNQPVYNALNRGVENEVMPACEELGMGLVVFSPLAQGVLTGKYAPGAPVPAGSRGADEKSNMFMADNLTDDVLGRVQKLKLLAEKHGATTAQFALAWCLRKAIVSSVIIGATRPEQIEENAKASGLELPEEVWAEAETILGDTGN
ncbi:MAG: aldo/keto reductase family protein [Fimbriimonadaceae bacterium]|nr:aldo/keto reductase family protein [Fimbriimonadaceae bacterium]